MKYFTYGGCPVNKVRCERDNEIVDLIIYEDELYEIKLSLLEEQGYTIISEKPFSNDIEYMEVNCE